MKTNYYAMYLDYIAIAKTNVNKCTARAACLFIGKASVYLDLAYQHCEINGSLYRDHIKAIDELFYEALGV